MQLIWRDLIPLSKGTRVVFAEPFDIYPFAFVPKGTAGAVVHNGLVDPNPLHDHMLTVLPDDLTIRGLLKDWNGEIHLFPCMPDMGRTDLIEADNPRWGEASPLELEAKPA